MTSGANTESRRFVPAGWILQLLWAIAGFAGCAFTPAVAQDQPQTPGVYGIDLSDDTPLVERDPFDKITLNQSGDNATMFVAPLGLRGPVNPAEYDGLLKFQILDRMEFTYVVPWRAVAAVETYDEMVINETRAAFQASDFDKAFRNLLFVFDQHGESHPVVQELLRPFLFFDAQHLLNKGQFELALSVFEELYQRDPLFSQPNQVQSLADIIAKSYDQILNELAAQGEFETVQAKLAEIRQKYRRPEPALARLLAQWDQVISQRLQDHIQKLVREAADPNPITAHLAIRQLAITVPGDPQTWQVFEETLDRLPMIFVGTSEPAVNPDHGAIDNWSARRIGRLVQRQLVSLVGLGDDGGLYAFEDGRVVPVDEFGRAFQFEIIDRQHRYSTPAMSAYELAQRIASLIDESSEDFYFPLAKLISHVEIVDDKHVEVTLNRPFARFESLFRVPRSPGDEQDRGPYRLDDQFTDPQSGLAVFRADEQLIRDESLQYPLIAEKTYPNASVAATALLRGEIDILERVFPADLYRLRGDANITIRPYSIPTVHLLVPNLRTEFMKDQMFRRGLVYAIDRERILRQLICGGQEIDGFGALSGPFPTGTEENDLIGYGYDGRIAVTEFDPRMAIISPAVVLGRMRKDAAERLQKEREEELKGLEDDEIYKKIDEWVMADPALSIPKLTLVHPNTDVAKTACQTMVQMWAAVGITVELRQLPPGATRPEDDDYDLLYLEISAEEPLADARRVFGELGLIKEINPSIEILLGDLDLAKNWVEARSILRQMHEQCQYDLIALPLWQTINYYAYRRHVRGIQPNLISLYDDVEQWRITLPNRVEP